MTTINARDALLPDPDGPAPDPARRVDGVLWNALRHLDRILRGEATSLPELRLGRFDIPIFGLALVIDLLGIAYGLCMGLFSLTAGGSGSYMQIPASMLKVPALFLLTLAVTLPSLYVFNALVGSRLTVLSVVRLLVASLAVMVAVLASLGPIVAFFSICTTSYSFIVLLHVAVFSVSGLLGLAFLLQTLHRMTLAAEPEIAGGAERRLAPPPLPIDAESPVVVACFDHAFPTAGSGDIPPSPPGPADSSTPGALSRIRGHVLGAHVKTVFRIWLLVFGLVGAQMGWVLRPFIGHAGQPFQWLRPMQSNFFEAVFRHLMHLIGA
jgi:hypothetical protein